MLALARPAWAQSETAPEIDPDPLTPIERPIEDEMILEMRLGRYILSDAFFGYLHRGGLLLPLGEMMGALDFPIVVDPVAGQADGWFLAENRRFSLDLARGEVVVAGRRESLPAGLVELHFDDIYVDTTVLADWFPVDLDFELSRLLIQVTSREPLPLEQRLAREKGRRFLGRGGGPRPQYPRAETPYRLLDWPFIDTSWFLGYANDADPRADVRSTTLLTGDVAGLNTQLFVAGDREDSFSDVRLSAGRKDPDGGMLGPLDLSEFTLGDVFTPQIPLVAGQREGRGVSVSSFRLTRPSEFDRTTLRGELPLGWEVELYRNEVLLEFRRSGADGRYEFADVPLLFGANVLRLLFYGPQGQTREEIRRFLIGAEQVRPGEQYFRVAVNQQDEDTVPVREIGFADAAQGKFRAIAEYERGLTRDLTLGAGLASFVLDDGARHNYASVGLRGAVAGAFLRLDAVGDSEGGAAFEASAQTELVGLNLRAGHEQLFNFVSDRFRPTDDPIASRTDIRLDGVIPETIVPRVQYSLAGLLERRESGRFNATLGNRLSAFFGGVSGSNTLNVRMTGGGGEARVTTADGAVLVNGRVGDLGLRGQLVYTIDPVAQLDSISATGDYAIDRGFSARLTVDRQLAQDQRTSVAASLFRLFKYFDLGFTTAYSDDGNFSAGLSISYGSGREPRTGAFSMRPRGIANSGGASARVFLDRNQNDLFDDGDEPIVGARFEGFRDVETDEDGIAFITGLAAYRPTGLGLDVGSLEDPFWLPKVDGVEVVPRPGRVAEVDFPVTPTGEVDGTVFLRRAGGLREVSNVRLQLVAPDGAVAAETRSQFDGFYLFEFVPPGRYTVRVSPEQVERLRLSPPPDQTVEVEAEGSVVGGIEFILDRLPTE